MKTLSANDFTTQGPTSKFPHTGPVAYDYGRLRFVAALKGIELKRADGKVRLFATAAAACAAILKETR